MKSILVLFLLLSSAPLLGMTRYRAPLTRQVLAYWRPRVAPPARQPAQQFVRAQCSQSQNSDDSDAQAKELRREIASLRTRKKLLLYSRPVVTVAGVATVNYLAPHFGLSQPELIASLMVWATMNTVAFHTAEERHSRQIKVAQKKLDELDKLD